MTPTDQIKKFIEENTADAFGSVLGYVRTRDALNIALARLEAAEARAASLEQQLAEAEALLEQVRSEALERFNAVDKDHTMDNDTEAWLLEVAQRLEKVQE